jgi:hypothetical protein
MQRICSVCDERVGSFTIYGWYLCEEHWDLVHFMATCAERPTEPCQGMKMTRVIGDIQNHPHYGEVVQPELRKKLEPLLNISYSRNRGEDQTLRKVWASLYARTNMCNTFL